MFVTVTDYHGNQIGIDPNRIIKIRQSGIADEPKKTFLLTSRQVALLPGAI
jgi:hypothetical protein